MQGSKFMVQKRVGSWSRVQQRVWNVCLGVGGGVDLRNHNMLNQEPAGSGVLRAKVSRTPNPTSAQIPVIPNPHASRLKHKAYSRWTCVEGGSRPARESRCPPRKKSRVARLKAKVEPLLT
jgi:hypothetical protein